MNELFRVTVVLKCVQPSVRSRRITLSLSTHADRIKLTAVHKIGSNWLTQEVFMKQGRDLNNEQTFLRDEISENMSVTFRLYSKICYCPINY